MFIPWTLSSLSTQYCGEGLCWNPRTSGAVTIQQQHPKSSINILVFPWLRPPSPTPYNPICCPWIAHHSTHYCSLLGGGDGGGMVGGGGICSRSLSSNWIVSRIFRPSGDIKCIERVSTSCQPWFQLTCKLFAHSRRVTFLESLCGLAALVWLCHLLHMTHSDSVISCIWHTLTLSSVFTCEC